MKNRIVKHSIGALAAMGVLSIAGFASASSHREALAILSDPCVDNTDVYAWVKPGTRDKLYVSAGYNGLHEPGQGNQQTRFCDDVLYEFHITRGVGELKDVVTYQIVFSSTAPTPDVPDKTNGFKDDKLGGGAELLYQVGGVKQTYVVTRVVHKADGTKTTTVMGSGLAPNPANIGPRTDRLAYGLGTFNPTDPASSSVSLYNEAFVVSHVHPLAGGGRAFAGEVADPYVLDEKAIFDVLNLAGTGRSPTLDNGSGGKGENVFDGFNLNAMALEIPITEVNGTGAATPHMGTPGDDTLLGVWASASRRQVSIRFQSGDYDLGPWTQVGREGLPLVNAGLIGVQDQGKYLRTTPRTDVANFAPYFTTPVLVRDLKALGTYAALAVPDSTVNTLIGPRTDILEIINLNDIPTKGAHHVPIAPGKTGDVLRVDIAIDSGFPNGRVLHVPGGPMDHEAVDVSDVLVTVIASGGAIPIGDGVTTTHNGPLLEQFPWYPVALQGLTKGHGRGDL
jgi:hypothetical protein